MHALSFPLDSFVRVFAELVRGFSVNQCIIASYILNNIYPSNRSGFGLTPGFTDGFLEAFTSEIIKDNNNPEQVHHLVLPSEKEA